MVEGGRGHLPSRSVRSWSVVTSRPRASQAMWASWGETAACGGVGVLQGDRGGGGGQGALTEQVRAQLERCDEQTEGIAGDVGVLGRDGRLRGAHPRAQTAARVSVAAGARCAACAQQRTASPTGQRLVTAHEQALDYDVELELAQMVPISKYRSTTRYRYRTFKVSQYRLMTGCFIFNGIAGRQG